MMHQTLKLKRIMGSVPEEKASHISDTPYLLVRSAIMHLYETAALQISNYHRGLQFKTKRYVIQLLNGKKQLARLL
jgi:hypothetical protein